MIQKFYVAAPAAEIYEAEGKEFDQNGEYLDLEVNMPGKNPWDEAHLQYQRSIENRYVEPVLYEQNPEAEEETALAATRESFAAPAFDDYDDHWPFPEKDGSPLKELWHLTGDFSQLLQAQEVNASSDTVIRIAHLDTGYDPEHQTFPAQLIEKLLEKNFLEPGKSARDTGSTGWLNQPGHGTGTLSILAGNTVDLPEYGYDGYLGLHHNIRIVPVRIAKSVVLWENKAFADALNYITGLYDDPNTRCHIVTMSMGGLPSKAWADAVNKAYDKGIFIVTAAGNNFGRATPSTLVYPARFKRVTAACGVTYDRSPYRKDFAAGNLGLMEGNYGPRSAMKNAIAAYTPNVPWAMFETVTEVSINGAGTSSATPQIASAAAMYYQQYHDEIEKYEGGQKVEIIRAALFASAAKEIAAGDDDDIELYFGNGLLRAAAMLAVKPGSIERETELPDQVRWPFWELILPLSSYEAEAETDETERLMFEAEILQLIAQSSRLQELLRQEELTIAQLSEPERAEFFQHILQMERASNHLKDFIVEHHLAD